MNFFHYWPQILMFFLMVANVLTTMAKEGEPVAKVWSFKTMMISAFASWFLLYSGGFFEEMHWPQFFMIGVYLLTVISGVMLDGEPRTDKQQVGSTVVTTLIAGWIYWAGGFWN